MSLRLDLPANRYINIYQVSPKNVPSFVVFKDTRYIVCVTCLSNFVKRVSCFQYPNGFFSWMDMLNCVVLEIVGAQYVMKLDNCSLHKESAIFCMETLYVLDILKNESYKLYDPCIKYYKCLKIGQNHWKCTTINKEK